MENLEGRDEFDRLLGEKLNNYREEPPLGIYTRVETSLAAKGLPSVKVERKGFARIWKYALAGVSLICMAGIISLFFIMEKRKVEMPRFSEYIAEAQEMTETASDNNIEGTNVVSGQKSQNQSVSEKIRLLLSDAANHTQPSEYMMQSVLKEDSENLMAVNELAANLPLETKENVSGIIRSAIDSREQDYRNNERNKTIENYWRDVFEEQYDLYDVKKRRRGFSTSLYAGNIGFGKGDYDASGVSQLAASNMVISKPTTIASVLLNDMENIRTSASEAPNLHHSMPVNIGVNISFPLSDRFSLVTGINYSYLFSRSSMNEISKYELSRRLHYLGIPLGISYDLWQRDRFSIYAYGGGMLEKALYGGEVRKLNGSVIERDRLSIKGVQPSVNAALGVMYKLTPGTGLYFEPGVSYYFEMLNQPASYRTEHPTNVSLKLGVKFTIE